SYTPHGEPAPAQPGSLAHFLVERYTLYSYAGGKLFRGRVHHSPYPLQDATIHTLHESLIGAAGIARASRDPIVHYARVVHTEIDRPELVVAHRSLAQECAKLDPREEQALADEGLASEVTEWPAY